MGEKLQGSGRFEREMSGNTPRPLVGTFSKIGLINVAANRPPFDILMRPRRSVDKMTQPSPLVTAFQIRIYPPRASGDTRVKPLRVTEKYRGIVC